MTDSQPRYTTKRLLDEIAKARAYGLELAAQLIDENVIQDTSAGKVLAPRQEGNRDGQHYAVSIRALIPSPSPTATATASTEVDVKTDRDLRETDHKTEREDDVAPHAAAIPPLGAEAKSPAPQDQLVVTEDALMAAREVMELAGFYSPPSETWDRAFKALVAAMPAPQSKKRATP